LKESKSPNEESVHWNISLESFVMRGLGQSKSHTGTSYRERGVSATRNRNYSISDSRQKST